MCYWVGRRPRYFDRAIVAPTVARLRWTPPVSEELFRAFLAVGEVAGLTRRSPRPPVELVSPRIFAVHPAEGSLLRESPRRVLRPHRTGPDRRLARLRRLWLKGSGSTGRVAAARTMLQFSGSRAEPDRG